MSTHSSPTKVMPANLAASVSPLSAPKRTVDCSKLAGGGSLVAHDGSLVHSDAPSRSGIVPGHYSNQIDYNMAHQTPRTGMRAVTRQSFSTEAISVPMLLDPASLASGAAWSSSASSAATYVPASATVRQVQAVLPPPGTPMRLVLLGPLRMIRSQCLAKLDQLRLILVWLDQYMGESLHTEVFSDSMISNIVYAVEIPMTDEHWLDWNKLLSAFPYAADWQEALTPGEPFDEVTGGHPTAPLFVEGEPLEALLVSLVRQYDFGAPHDVQRPWDEPGQTEWSDPMARETGAGR